MITAKNPIGIFDSGVGGTSIWREIHQLLPKENCIYLADSNNAPYGQKSKQEIIDLSTKNTDILLSLGCKLIVVACNTATTNAIKELRNTYSIPFIGIEPAIKPAALNSNTQRIGVLATKGTLSSELFHNALKNYPHVKIIEQIGYNLVHLIEEGKKDSKEIKALLKSYLDPMIDEDIDYLVLGCTHYPYLIEHIKEILPPHIKIIDSGRAVAKQTKRILDEFDLTNNSENVGTQEFFTNKNPRVLQELIGDSFQAIEKNF